jgi:hypothetical protein
MKRFKPRKMKTSKALKRLKREQNQQKRRIQTEYSLSRVKL